MRLAISSLVLSLFVSAAVAQTFTRPRIRGYVDDRVTVERGGNRPALARPESATGDVAPETRLERMMLVLTPSPEQEQALEQLIAEQHDPQSPNYQRWLTPAEFGRSFGVAEGDVAAVTSWLESHGFVVEPALEGRRALIFSGTAAEVERAFHTRLKTYQAAGRGHMANATHPRIPEALSGVVAGVVSLHDFRKGGGTSRAQARPLPEYSAAGGQHYLTPADFAVIYDAAALYAAGMDGAGQSIAIVGRSNITPADVDTFRSFSGLPVNRPTVVLNGVDPGIVQGDYQEAMSDVEWAGAVAPKASVTLVASKSTNTADGVDLSAAYIVNRNLAPVVTVSYGLCEALMGAAEITFYNSLWKQAAAQGMTVLVSSGDSGVAGCDAAGASAARMAAGVNGLCTSPYSTCVGGTMFAEAGNPAKYWSAANNAATRASALSYIPEMVWNESGASGGSGLWSGGGGASAFYPKPAWQTGPGVPADGKRDVPDVALAAASHDGYIAAMQGGFWIMAGTSLASPSLAGLLALVAQKQGGRLGNANPVLYALAANQAKGGAPVFHDVTAGDNSVPGLAGFSAAPGYDLATGLGSVDAFVLANHWKDAAPSSQPSFTLALSKTAVVVAKGVNQTLQVTPTAANGFNAAVTLAVGGLPKGVAASFAPASVAPGTASTLTLSADATAAAGAYTPSIAGSAGTVAASATLNVQVCTYALDAAPPALSAAQQAMSTKVTAGAGCGWSAASDSPWLTFTSAANGTGAGFLNWAVTANTTSAARQATITLNGASIVVKQAAPSLTLGASAGSVPYSGGSVTVAVSAVPSTTPWTAATTAAWITISKGASSVTLTAAANPGAAPRSGAVTIAGLAFTLLQDGAPSFQLDSAAANVPSAGGSGVVKVTATPATARWQASSGAPWVTLTVSPSQVAYVVAPNLTPLARSAALTIAGRTFTVNQAGMLCAATVTAGPLTASATALTGTLTITEPAAGCSWTAVSNVPWIALTSALSGAGSGKLGFSLGANSSTAARTGTLTVAGKTVSITESKGLSAVVTVLP